MHKLTTIFKTKRSPVIKVRLQRYFKNRDEPQDNPSHDAPFSDETVLVGNSPLMRQRFRGVAQRIRVIKKYKRNS